MSGSNTTSKIPYSLEEDKALVEFIRNQNAWHRIRGNQIWDKEFLTIKVLQRSPSSAKERFLKRLINFDRHPSNRKLFTPDELKILESNCSNGKEIGEDFSAKRKDPLLRLSSYSTTRAKNFSSGFTKSNLLSQISTETSDKGRGSKLTTEFAIQSYKDIFAIHDLTDENVLEWGIIKTLETVILTYELMLREKSFEGFLQAKQKTPVEIFEYLVTHKVTGDALLDRLPDTLITLVMIAKEICIDRRNTASEN